MCSIRYRLTGRNFLDRSCHTCPGSVCDVMAGGRGSRITGLNPVPLQGLVTVTEVSGRSEHGLSSNQESWVPVRSPTLFDSLLWRIVRRQVKTPGFQAHQNW